MEREPPVSTVILTDEERGLILVPGEAPVPASITPRQARLALLAAGLLDDVETAVSGADKATQIAWEFATSIERGNPVIAAMAGALSLSDAQVDDLFRAAALIP